MLSVLCLTGSFPVTPIDRSGNFVYHSISALTQLGINATVIVALPYVPSFIGRIFGKPATRIDAKAFDEFDAIETLTYPSIPRNYAKRLVNPIFDACVSAALYRTLKHRKIDLIHAHGENFAPAVAKVAHAYRIPSFITLHGIDMCRRYRDAPAQRKRFGSALNAVDRVILVGEPLRAFATALTGHDQKFRIVPNGFFPPAPSVFMLARQRSRLNGRIELISVSNLHEGKGIDVNLKALAALVHQGYSNWRYRIVGDGDQRSALEGLVRSLRLEEAVVFLGPQAHGAVYELLASADVFILPSYREAFGIAYLEAMSLGLLVIGVRGQGPEAFVRDTENGILVAPRNAEALTARLIEIFTNPARYLAMADQGCREAWGNWTWACHAQRLLDAYQEVLGGVRG